MNSLTKINLLLLTAAVLLCSRTVPAAEAPSANAIQVQNSYTQQLASAAGSSNYFVRPGLWADRDLKKVSFWAEATGIATGEPVEFYVISPKSGHAYESLAVSFAKPSDIHAALEFIGLKPGALVDYDRLRLWPKGERVFLTCYWEGGEGMGMRKPVESLLVDTDTGTVVPAEGFCFTGSTVQDGVYTADENEPGSIASDFNDLSTVLDVPFKRDKSAVYRRFTANPDLRIPAGKLVRIEIEPEYKDGTLRVADLALRVSAVPDGASWKDAACSIEWAGSTTNTTPEGLMDYLQGLIEKGKTPYANLQFAPDVPLAHAVETCRFLELLCTDKGIRIEPPAEGQLFHKAFLPQPEFRRREDRPSQPWELQLGGTNGLKLVQISEIWPDDAPKPELKIKEYAAQNPAEALSIMRDQGIGIPVLVIFAPGSTSYGELVRLADALRDEFKTVYVFSGSPEE